MLGTGISVLQWAIKDGDFELVKLLVEKGADVNFTDIDGDTVFSYGCSYLPDGDLLFLLENGTDPTGRAKSGRVDPATGKEITVSYFEKLLFWKKLTCATYLLNDSRVLESVLGTPTIDYETLDVLKQSVSILESKIYLEMQVFSGDVNPGVPDTIMVPIGDR